MAFGNGGGRFEGRRNRFGNMEFLSKLYATEKGGVKGLITVHGRTYKVFITRANTPKKPGHTHWIKLEDASNRGSGF